MTEAAPTAARPGTDAAYDRCARLARRHYENFPVRSLLVPAAARDDLAAVYAFCRTTDDLGDELEGDRVAALEAWRRALLASLDGSPPAGDPVLAALAATAARRSIPAEPLLRLVEANLMDQRIAAYPDAPALLDYCRHSATPVGRMVLAVAGDDGPGLVERADATCIGLQLANFWQDLERDRERGRCYLPLEACRRHGVDPAVELDRDRASPALVGLVAELVGWARGWLVRGWPLADRMSPRWRPLVRGFSRGGWAVCDAIEASGFDTLRERPTVGRLARRAIAIHELLRARRTAPRPTGVPGPR